MRFHLTSEQIAIQDAVRGTLRECWGMEQLHALAESDADFDPACWAALMALGVGGLALPEADGGAGLGLLEAALVCEIAGEAAAPGPLIGQILAAIAVSASGNAQTRALLPAIAAGERIVALALDHDLVPCARAADLFLTDDDAGGLRLVEAGEGVGIEPQRSTDRSRPVSRVQFRTAGAHPLFAAGDPMVQRLRDAALVLIAADALGGAQHCTDLSVDYAKTREQFGQPIGRFQGLKHQLAHMTLDVEPARALLWYAAYAWDAGLPDASHAAAVAKAHLCDVYTRSARAAVAAHGGIGYTWEYGLNYWFRRALHDGAWLGSPPLHRARAAELAGW
ncbi:acyl-CoA/acyl-ACP dehydrogenase [Novosphingobium sp. KCTC 2891]|uniref:acyl-CoA dehydrogenase family protein n=1 Tax=Novosphingobium sp. KCTC 2891 TaxID=2989730 RepID=UPI002222EC35|nr:acyl-CoA dehydrogenase family protein [Novosphingobium sp. KCTC 2891]MCW1383661.1 acyl-CoA/acyl-ACP dehydrogenase [Novosphingobium sp. KCTC 2891]